MPVWKTGRGALIAGTVPALTLTSTVISVPSVDRKNSDFPSPLHRGWAPPATDTCHRAPVGGTGIRYTSPLSGPDRPNASHLASGENRPSSTARVEVVSLKTIG